MAICPRHRRCYPGGPCLEGIRASRPPSQDLARPKRLPLVGHDRQHHHLSIELSYLQKGQGAPRPQIEYPRTSAISAYHSHTNIIHSADDSEENHIKLTPNVVKSYVAKGGGNYVSTCKKHPMRIYPTISTGALTTLSKLDVSSRRCGKPPYVDWYAGLRGIFDDLALKLLSDKLGTAT